MEDNRKCWSCGNPSGSDSGCAVCRNQIKPSTIEKVQHGGSHYKRMGIEPVQYCHANGLNFLEGSAVKYITRHRDKGKVEDVKKAIHYLQMILEFEYQTKSTVTY